MTRRGFECFHKALAEKPLRQRQNRSKAMRVMKPVLRLCGSLLVLALSCRDSAFSQASKADTVTAYRQFLEQNPNDINRENAQSRLEELEFEAAQKAHTAVAYKRFLSDHPEGPYVSRVQQRLEGLRFNAAVDKNTVAGWRLFLNEHPTGAHREEAETALLELETQKLESGTPPAPGEPLSAAAAQVLAERRAQVNEAQAFQDAQNTRQLLDYLEAFPSGAHRDDVKGKLLRLEVESLLFEGEIEAAKTKMTQSPLAASWTDWPKAVAEAQRYFEALNGTATNLRPLSPQADLFPLAEVLASLESSAAFDRSQAASSLGFYMTPQVIAPLLRSIRVGRTTLVRQRAFESLRRVFRLMPRTVADYALTTRLADLSTKASDEGLSLPVAVLLDIQGRVDDAASEYQKAYAPQDPDPLILRRLIELRMERGKQFSAAVACRTLALESKRVFDELQVAGNGVTAAREYCGAVEMARFAAQTLAKIKQADTSEFAADVESFEKAAQATLTLGLAKLRDAELVMLTAAPGSPTCGTDPFSERIQLFERQRLAQVKTALQSTNEKVKAFVKQLALHDWSEPIRAAIDEAKTVSAKKRDGR